MLRSPNTLIESFSLINTTCETLDKWDRSKVNPRLGAIGARTIGLIATAAACLVDAVAHQIFTILKLISALMLSPYFVIRSFINRSFTPPKDLTLSSVLYHQIKALQSFILLPFLPPLTLLDFNRAVTLTRRLNPQGQTDGGLLEIPNIDDPSPSNKQENEQLLTRTPTHPIIPPPSSNDSDNTKDDDDELILTAEFKNKLMKFYLARNN